MPAIAAGFVVGLALDCAWPWSLAAVLVGLVLGVAFALWLGVKQYRYTYWRLDEDGLAIRRGRMWQRETRVPATRVQHLDIKRGPLQRRRHLSTLVVHTAGTRHSAVTLPHLDADDAQRLRDRLGRQLDLDDDA
jgi:membrane protein YdbS with pleckstrin-like domain